MYNANALYVDLNSIQDLGMQEHVAALRKFLEAHPAAANTVTPVLEVDNALTTGPFVDFNAYEPLQQEILQELLPLFDGKNMQEIAVIINERAGRIINPNSISIKGLINQIDITLSELNEVRKAAESMTPGLSTLPENMEAIKAFADAVADVELCNLGQAARLPIDIRTEYLNVCLTNLTRIPRTLEEAEATVAKWAARGIDSVISEGRNPDGSRTYPVLTVDRVQTDTSGEVFSPNKFLKGINTIIPKNYGVIYPVTIAE